MALILLLLLSEPAPNHHSLEIINVYDGDTIRANVDLGFDVSLTNKSIRLQGFDAWEISRVRQTVTITNEEIQRAFIARDDLRSLLEQHPGRAFLVPDKMSVYGRLGGFLFVFPKDGPPIDVAKWMIERGHTRNPGDWK